MLMPVYEDDKDYDLPEPEAPPEWSDRRQDVAATLWPSFLAAAVASVLFFGLVDPMELSQISSLNLEVGRMTGYAIGFFFFWLIGAGSSALGLFLIRTANRHKPHA